MHDERQDENLELPTGKGARQAFECEDLFVDAATYNTQSQREHLRDRRSHVQEPQGVVQGLGPARNPAAVAAEAGTKRMPKGHGAKK